MNVFNNEIKLVIVSTCTLKLSKHVNLRQLASDQLRGENFFLTLEQHSSLYSHSFSVVVAQAPT